MLNMSFVLPGSGHCILSYTLGFAFFLWVTEVLVFPVIQTLIVLQMTEVMYRKQMAVQIHNFRK